MARPTPEEIRQRRERMPEVEGLGGWFVSKLCDGEDEDGNRISWYEYEHLDGRTATEWHDGTCSDPELRSLLTERRRIAPPAKPDPLEQLSSLGLMRFLERWINRR